MADAGDLEQEYLPIAEHGLVGDLHTVALVGTNGTIDWYCCPAFDSPSVFGSHPGRRAGRLLRAAPRGRRLELQAALLPRHQHPDHALLHARRRGRGAGLHADRGGRAGDAPAPADPARGRACAARCGSVIEVQPRFDYGRAEHEVEMHPHGVLFRSPDLTLALEGAIAKAMGSRAAARARRRRRARDVRPRRRRVADVRARARAARTTSRGPYPEHETAAPFDATVTLLAPLARRSRATGAAGARWCTARR